MCRNSQNSHAKKPDDLQAEDVADRRPAADGRHVAVVAVAERLERLARRSRAGCCAPRARPAASRPAPRRAAACRPAANAHRSPTTKISGCPGTASVGSACTRPARSSGTPSDFASGDAATPAAHSTVCASMRSVVAEARHARRSRHAVRVDAGDDRAGPHLDAEALERSRAPRRAAARETARSRYGLPSTSDDARRLRAGCCGSPARSDCRAISASAPASSTPVGPPPTMTNVSSRRCFAGSRFALGRLERQQHPPPHLERIVERLEPGRARRPFGWPK